MGGQATLAAGTTFSRTDPESEAEDSAELPHETLGSCCGEAVFLLCEFLASGGSSADQNFEGRA